jgi:hypothetical protein
VREADAGKPGCAELRRRLTTVPAMVPVPGGAAVAGGGVGNLNEYAARPALPCH